MCSKILITTSLCGKQLILFTNVIHFKLIRHIKLEKVDGPKVDRDNDFVSEREVYIDLQYYNSARFGISRMHARL